MRRVNETDYGEYIKWARANTANTVYPCSIAEGFQTGEIYVNDGPGAGSVFFWHHCGFGYISGDPSDGFLNDICSMMTEGHVGRRLVLITSDDHVTAFFRHKDVHMDRRAEYAYPQNGHTAGKAVSDYRIERIDRDNISKIEGRIIPSFSWGSPELFLKEGFGYIALQREKVCAVSFSAAVSSEEIDIGVETHEDHRGKGLAAMLAGRMCDHIVEIRKRPVWAHSVSNTGSMNTALRCGFVRERIDTVIRKRDTAKQSALL